MLEKFIQACYLCLWMDMQNYGQLLMEISLKVDEISTV